MLLVEVVTSSGLDCLRALGFYFWLAEFWAAARDLFLN